MVISCENDNERKLILMVLATFPITIYMTTPNILPKIRFLASIVLHVRGTTLQRHNHLSHQYNQV